MSVFHLTPAQAKAAAQAMNGLSPLHFLHVFLMGVAVMVLLWFLFIVLGMYHSLQTRDIALGDALGTLAIAALIVIVTGIVMHYP